MRHNLPKLSRGPFTRELITSGLTIVRETTTQIVHNWGVTPKLIRIEAICTASEHNFNANDVICLNDHIQKSHAGTTAANAGLTVLPTKTDLTVIFGNGVSGTTSVLIGYQDASTASSVMLSISNWTVRVKAWA